MAIKIVFFDCDGTLTDVRSSWQHIHERLDLWDDNADRFQTLFRAGVISYHEFCSRDAALWRGVTVETILRIMAEIRYHEGVGETIRALRSEGIATVVVSTGLSMLVDRAKEDLGMTYAVANELVAKDGVLTGEIRINVDHDQKGLWVKRILSETGLQKSEAAAVGDSEGDRAMFEEVGLAIGYRPHEGILSCLDFAVHDGSFAQILGLLKESRRGDWRRKLI